MSTLRSPILSNKGDQDSHIFITHTLFAGAKNKTYFHSL